MERSGPQVRAHLLVVCPMCGNQEVTPWANRGDCVPASAAPSVLTTGDPARRGQLGRPRASGFRFKQRQSRILPTRSSPKVRPSPGQVCPEHGFHSPRWTAQSAHTWGRGGWLGRWTGARRPQVRPVRASLLAQQTSPRPAAPPRAPVGGAAGTSGTRELCQVWLTTVHSTRMLIVLI